MANAALRALEKLRNEFGGTAAARRLRLLRQLQRARLQTAREVERLHELLCFARAYPDDAAVLELARAMLAAFAARPDLRRHAARLADSGIAGTAIRYSFYAATASRLAERWPALLRIEWGDWESANADALESLLPLLALWAETPALDELPLGLREWIEAMRGAAADGAFVVRGMQRAHPDPFVFEHAFERLELPLRLDAGADTPSRTRAEAAVDRVVFQQSPLDGARPELHRAIRERPVAVREVSRRDGERYVDLARDAMVTRARDLDAFAYGDPDDVRVVEWENGLQFAVIGVRPERRLLLEAVYGFLTLKNGAPIGYVLNSALFGSAEIAYNVFDTFRGGEAGLVYGRVLATVRLLFGTDTFTIYPYQLGEDNDEALQSGAWWFYQKLGFRPRERALLRRMERELGRMKARKGYRSSIATLRELATANVYWHDGEPRDDVIGLLPLGNVGLAVTKVIAERFAGDRDRAEAACTAEACKLLGVRSRGGWTASEWLWLQRWSPLVAALPGVAEWRAADLRQLRDVIRAKGGRREFEFVRAFDAHERLRDAVRRLATGE